MNLYTVCVFLGLQVIYQTGASNTKEFTIEELDSAIDKQVDVHQNRSTGEEKWTDDEIADLYNNNFILEGIGGSDTGTSSLSSNKKLKLSFSVKQSKNINYSRTNPHTVKLTETLDRLLTDKEELLKCKGDIHEWSDFQTPLAKNTQYWDDLCVRIWPGLPNVNGTPICASLLKPFKRPGSYIGGKSYIGYLHNTLPENLQQDWSFLADLLFCNCRYINIVLGKECNAHTVRFTYRYFFVMKLSDDEKEYLLLTHIKEDKKWPNLKIVDYKKLL